jgi:hypothetical protein
MATLTVNIAAAGTPLQQGGTSTPGHMWYSIDRGDGSPPESFGFAPAKHGEWLPTPGRVYDNDTSNYLTTYDSRTVQISDDQFLQLRDFGVNPVSYDFSMRYNGLWNSCIDFTWKALEVAGINYAGFQGDVWPTFNRMYVDTTLQLFESGSGVAKPPPSPLRTSDTVDGQGRMVESIVTDGSGRTLYKRDYAYDADGSSFTVTERDSRGFLVKEQTYQTASNGDSSNLTTKYFDRNVNGKLADQQSVTYQPDGSVAIVRQDRNNQVYQIDTQTVAADGTTIRISTQYKDEYATDQTTTVTSTDGSSVATTTVPDGSQTIVH